MAHYAFLNEDNIVIAVIVGRDENEIVDGISDWELYYSELRGQTCKRTSFNTNGGKDPNGGVGFRKNFAGIGFVYDSERDAFISPKPFESWLLDEETCQWKSPVNYPEDGQVYEWDEATQHWIVSSSSMVSEWQPDGE